MQHSIVRRSLLVVAAFVAGHLFHYALMIGANQLLDPAGFGRFYASISLLNVLLTPATVLTFMFAQHFSVVMSAAGPPGVGREFRRLFARHLRIGSALVLLGVVGLLIAASVIGADAVLLLVLLPGVALAVYLFEMARAALQAMLAFWWYSVTWILWRAGQFVLALGALAMLGAAWAGLAGILAASVVAVALLLALVAHRCRGSAIGTAHAGPFRLAGAWPFLRDYGAFILVNNIDVLLAYLVLGNDQLGAYAASSFLPKAIVTATQPVSQVMLPVMTATGAQQRPRRTALVKALLVTAVLGAAGAAVLSAAGDLICDERFGVRFCSPSLLAVLSLAAVPLGVLRVLVVAGLAAGHGRKILLSALAIVAFAAAVWLWAGSPLRLAVLYAGLGWVLLAAYGLSSVAAARLKPSGRDAVAV